MSSCLTRLGLEGPTYDKFPFVAVPGHAALSGWPYIGERLLETIRTTAARVVAVDCYSGVFEEEIACKLAAGLKPALTLRTGAAFRPAAEIDRMVEPFLGGGDPIFGRLTSLVLEDFFDPARREDMQRQSSSATGLVLVVGVGATLCCSADLVVFCDLPRWEAQLRQRRNEISNLGVENSSLKASLQYKRSFFVDWRVCDKHKRRTLPEWDFLLDTTHTDLPVLITGEALRDGLKIAASRPFRVVPFFDPGPWGGQWMREVCELPPDAPNYAWCFDCVPEENSLLLGFGETRVEIPAINLVLSHPEELLGEPVFGRFGAEFPIRFDFLDTMGGGNLSFQVHPTVDYAREHFGLSYTQDESYYILDAEPGAVVFLGCKNGTDPEVMFDALTAAQRGGNAFDDQRFAARFTARPHDHFLIPAGTLHCSGAGSMVLEISATPYIFTFKLWDWNRLGLDGLPRPVNLERGRSVVRWERDEDYARRHLVNQVKEIARGEHWREECTGLHPAEFIETRRHWFTGPVPHDTKGESVHVLNLVQGPEAIVESPAGRFAPFVVHYAETFIVPASVGPYTIRPSHSGKECATMKAFVRVNA